MAAQMTPLYDTTHYYGKVIDTAWGKLRGQRRPRARTVINSTAAGNASGANTLFGLGNNVYSIIINLEISIF